MHGSDRIMSFGDQAIEAKRAERSDSPEWEEDNYNLDFV